MEKFVGKEAVESSFHKLLPPRQLIVKRTRNAMNSPLIPGKGRGREGKGKRRIQ